MKVEVKIEFMVDSTPELLPSAHFQMYTLNLDMWSMNIYIYTLNLFPETVTVTKVLLLIIGPLTQQHTAQRRQIQT